MLQTMKVKLFFYNSVLAKLEDLLTENVVGKHLFVESLRGYNFIRRIVQLDYFSKVTYQDSKGFQGKYT